MERIFQRSVYITQLLSHHRAYLRFVNNVVSVASCRINSLLFADDSAVPASSQPILQQALHTFSATDNQSHINVLTRKLKHYVATRNPRHWALQVSDNIMQHVEKWFRVDFFKGDESRNKTLDRWIGEANALLRELYHYVVTKW